MKVPILNDLRAFHDDRGFFVELWKQDEEDFFQDNFSWSKPNVFRGFHFQNPYPQGKLITVLSGSVVDIVIDLRKHSETYKKYEVYVLSGTNHKQLFVPQGFAHGFVAMEETCFFYKNTNKYCKECEHTLKYNDEDINIRWGEIIDNTENLIISEKDILGKSLKQLDEENLLF